MYSIQFTVSQITTVVITSSVTLIFNLHVREFKTRVTYNRSYFLSELLLDFIREFNREYTNFLVERVLLFRPW